MIETKRGPAERLDRWIERHLTGVLVVMIVLAVALIGLDEVIH